MYWVSKSIHILNRLRRQSIIFLSVLGPGIIVMVADNDAGGISTYAVTGSKYGFSLLWIFIILLPMAYFVQEMTVRLGAVTKRGHAEAIFDGFGPFWGWFSLIDLAITNWLTLVTEYIGMTAAMSLFGIPPWITFIAVTMILFAIVLSGQYWTFEKITLFFCLFNLVYIPAAFWGMDTPTAPGWDAALRGFYNPDIGGLNMALIFIILANIGTTIAPWMLFFQQSAVVDKGLDIHDIKFGKLETFVGSVSTCVVAVFIIIATAAVFYYHKPPILIEDAKQTAEAIVPLLPVSQGVLARKLFAIGLFDAGFLGALCISLSTSWAVGEVFGWAHSLNEKVKEAPWFYIIYLL
ncbi:MAG: divalent metal cation transporter, partial [Syntrophales bacterium]